METGSPLCQMKSTRLLNAKENISSRLICVFMFTDDVICWLFVSVVLNTAAQTWIHKHQMLKSNADRKHFTAAANTFTSVIWYSCTFTCNRVFSQCGISTLTAVKYLSISSCTAVLSTEALHVVVGQSWAQAELSSVDASHDRVRSCDLYLHSSSQSN